MERAIPVLPADDLSAAKAFYTSLGFGVLWEASEDGRNGIMGSPAEGSRSPSTAVEDADAWWREWSSVVPGLRPPRDEEWGARTFGLNDPAGNTIFVIGPPREKNP